MIRPVRPDGTIETGGVFIPVARRRVLDRVASAAMQRVVLIVAPAGYGKSVALGQYLETLKERHVRYDVLPENVNLLAFLRGFADALVEVAPDARVTLPGAYERNAASSSPGIDLAHWMHSHLKGFHGVIAIDDLHLAQEDREVTRFLASLIERTKGRVQWMIASRSTLGLPIGTWLAYGESDLAIDEHDLKFSVEEARDAARSFRLAVRDEELYELLNLTDGWATAMSFALRSSTRSVDLRNISSMTREMIYRYLAEQVYESLRDDDREFLETAGLLPEIDVDALVSIGFDRAAVMLEELRERVAFISEPEPGRYRLHDLFREFTTHQLELRGNSVAQERRTNLARVLLEQGRPALALRLLVEAQAFEETRGVLEEHGVALATHGYADDVDAALSHVPKSEGGIVRALRGLIATSRGNYAEGERLLQRALPGIADAARRAQFTLRLALLRVNRGDDVREDLGALLQDEQVPENQKVEARAMLAGFHAMRAETEPAHEMIRSVMASLDEVDDQETLARALQRVGFAHQRLGESHEASALLKEAVEVATRHGLWTVASRAYGLLAEIAIFSEVSPSLSIWNAQQAAAAASRAGDYYDLQLSLLMMLSIETQRGNADRQQQLERQLAELSSNDASRTMYIATSQAYRCAWSGRFDDAQRLFGSVLDRHHFTGDRAIIRALYALMLALDGQTKQSGLAVDKAVRITDEADLSDRSAGLYVEIASLLCVTAEIVNGRLTVAARLFKRRPRSSHEMATCMRGLVDELMRAARNPSYQFDEFEQDVMAIRDFGYGGFARIFDLVKDRIEAKHTESAEEVVLTPGELRVLRSLAAGMTPKEIAAEMGRSVYTVQTHIQNITSKLGCHGRAEAIAAARRMGLLMAAGNGST